MTEKNQHQHPAHHHKPTEHEAKIATATTTILTPGHPPVVVKNDVIANAAAIQKAVEREVAVVQKLAAVPFFGAVKALFILGFLLAGLIIYECRDQIVAAIVKSVDKSVSIEHNDALKKALANHKIISPLIGNLREDIKASRAAFLQFHNGQNSLKGVPFLFASQTETAVAPGIDNDQLLLQRVPISTFIDWLPKFLEHECVIDSVDTVNNSLKELMKEHGINTTYACPVFTPGAAEPAGFVSISYIAETPLKANEALAIAKMRVSAQVIGGLLEKSSLFSE